MQNAKWKVQNFGIAFGDAVFVLDFHFRGNDRALLRGLICVWTCVEPCRSYSVGGDRASKKLVLRPCLGKCLHLYHYWMDTDFVLMHGRLQTWFPFTIQICLNGRSWLARQMDHRGLGYKRRENCFPWLEDVCATQRLMDKLLRLHWATFLDKIASERIGTGPTKGSRRSESQRRTLIGK
jgi:hypothetical protein